MYQQKQTVMNTVKFFNNGSTFNKVQFSEIEFDLDKLNLNINECFILMADEKEFVYVSDGFLTGLRKDIDEIESGEWHHYFKKDENGNFDAFKLNFN